MAAFTRIAFSNACLVRIFDSFKSSRTIATARMPDICASTYRRAATAGIAALWGREVPSASAMQAIVEAVPMVLQVPAERDMTPSAARKSSRVIVPAFTCSLSCQTTVPEPMSCPLCLPLSIGPPVTTMAGTSQLAAPISNAGVVLSQPVSSTTPSIGLPRMASSTSMLARLRVSMAVGRRFDSPLENTGNSTGKPPASEMPRFTCSAILRKCALHGVSSDQVLQMPTMGRPSNSWSGMPWFFIQLRYMKPFLSAEPNHSAERNFLVIESAARCARGEEALQQAEHEQQRADHDARPPRAQR